MKTPQINRLILLLLAIIFLFVVLDRHSRRAEISPPVSIAATPTIPQIEKNINIQTPKMNAEINSGFLLSGTARVFENVVTYRLKDTKNNILAQGNLIAAAPDIGQFGPFETNVSYSAPVTQFGYLEVFTLSAKDGSEIDKQILYLKFGQ